MTECELLDRYARSGDAEAFTLLVERYQRLILATCRRRLHHATDVDDAVQETFLRMAKAAGSVKSNVGAWLHRCATNVSTDLNRRRQTRSQHESQVVPAVSNEQNELAELREHLDAAMEKLEDDERNLIVQRFFVGRTQVELADEAGVAPSSISVRLNNAIDHLREHLKAAGYSVAAGALIIGLEKENASAAVPAELSAKIARVGLSGVTAAASGLGFAWPLAIFLISLALGVWGIHYFSKSAPNSPAPIVADVQPATAPVALTVDTSKSPAGEPPKWLPNKTAPAVAGVLTGQIVDRAGKPVVGAIVNLIGFDDAQTKTDDQGRYAFTAGKPQDGEYQVGVTADGFQEIAYWTGANPKIAISAATPGVRNFVLDRGVLVTTIVRNSHGEPLPNARVEALPGDVHVEQRHEPSSTDEDGICKIMVAPSKTPCTITAVLEGYAPVHQELLCESPDQPQEMDLVLSPGITVNGVAICSDGKPATGWGIVADPVWSRSNYSSDPVMIDSAGKFSLQHIMAGKYRLKINRHMQQQSLGEYTLPPASPAPLRVNVPGPSPAGMFTITGKLHCDGPLSEGMIVDVRGTGANSGFFSSSLAYQGSAWGDQEYTIGAPFSIADIPAGIYELTFQSPQVGSVKVKNITVPSDAISVDLKIIRKPHLTGHVVDPSGKPVTHFAVRIRQTQHLGSGPNYVQDANWIQVSNADGAFDVELVGPGIYQAQASAPGYAWSWSAQIKADSANPIANTTVLLSNGGALQGCVIDAAGHPITGAKVIPLSMSANISMSYPRGGFSGEAGSVLTDAQGHFVISHLSPGDESIKITRADFAPLIVGQLKITEGQTTDAAPAVLLAGGSVQGTVYDATGNIADGVVIDLQDDKYYHYGRGELAAHLLGSATTDSAGHFRVDHLPPGQDICVERSYGSGDAREGVVRRTANLVDGQTQQLDFGGPTPVRGRLLIAGKPAAAVPITLSIGEPSFGSTLIHAQTDNDGKFIFFSPPPGDYTLSCANADSFNRQLLLGDFTLTQPPHDIGDVNQDIGKITIHLNAEDAANVGGIELERRDTAEWFKRMLNSAAPDEKDPTVWSNNAVPPGRLRMKIAIKGNANREFCVPFERMPGAAETSITAPRFPKATATLTTQAGSAGDKSPRYTILKSDDDINEITLSNAPTAARSVTVPPGTYYVIDQRTEQRRADVPPIKATAGQTTAVDLNFPLPVK